MPRCPGAPIAQAEVFPRVERLGGNRQQVQEALALALALVTATRGVLEIL